MAGRVTYERSDIVGVITMDDGKANALSVGMFDEIDAAFDAAEADGVVAVLTGRHGLFSGGFDLEVLLSAHPDSVPMMIKGFELAHRLLSFPRPVVMACSGHAYAMGLFLLLAGDYRIGVAGATHKYTANEVAIGLTVPHAPLEILRASLTPRAFSRAVNLAEIFTPASAVQVGILDEVVPEGELLDRARTHAQRLAELNMDAYAATKRRSSAATLTGLRAAIDADADEFRAIFVVG